MPSIDFQGTSHECNGDETVLDCLTRHGVPIPNSCRGGVCQSCLMKAESGTPHPKSQTGLKASLRDSGYFLACLCTPEADMAVALPGTEALARTTAIVVEKRDLNRDIIRLTLQCADLFPHRPGQFLRLVREDGLIRSYSIANPPWSAESPPVLELHVRRLPGGSMSQWIHNDLGVGDCVRLEGPSGDCFYTGGSPEQSLLLIGTGCGMAPLWGIANDALAQGHIGPIYLYQGSWNPVGLYLKEELQTLASQHDNFHFTQCVDEGAVNGLAAGRADEVAFDAHKDLPGWKVFLCGHPEMVKTARKRAFLAGASMGDIYSDPFVLSPRQEGCYAAPAKGA